MQPQHTRPIGRFVALFLAVGFVATTAFGSKSFPISGTAISLKVGQAFKLNIFGVGGCNFDYVTSASTVGVVGIDRSAGANTKKVTIELTGLAVGSSDVTVMTMNGTNPCPAAVHVFPVTVVADVPGLVKAFSSRTKDEFNDFRFDVKASYNLFKSETLALNAQYKDDAITADQLTDSVFDGFTSTMSQLWSRGWMASWDVSQYGTNLLSGNGVATGEGPNTIFPGSCGSFDSFNGKLNGELEKTFDSAKGQAKLSLGNILKKDGYQVLLTAKIVEIYSKGPLYSEQTSTPDPTIPTSIMATLSRPTTNVGADNGRIHAGGLADEGVGLTFEVKLTKSVNGQPDAAVVLTPTISSDHYWKAIFPNLTPGHYTVRAGFQGEASGYERIVYVPKFTF